MATWLALLWPFVGLEGQNRATTRPAGGTLMALRKYCIIPGIAFEE